MLNLKNNPAGLDSPIQALQVYLYNQLKQVLWKNKVDDTTMEGYGRVYRNRYDKGYVPEVFVSSSTAGNTTYEQVFFDKTTKNALFFFDPDDKEVVKGAIATRNVSIVFIVNIAKLKSTEHRGDEEVRNEIMGLLSTRRFGFTVTGMDTGFKNVFARYDGITNKDGEVYEDRHPIHCFKINLQLIYNVSKNC